MTIVRTFCVTEEINNRLKNVKHISALICALLENHFKLENAGADVNNPELCEKIHPPQLSNSEEKK